MDKRYQVKQYLTRLVTRGGRQAFDVFNSGESGWIIFCPIAGHVNGIGGWQGGLYLTVKRTDLKRDIARLIPRP